MSFILGSNRPRTYLELNCITPALCNNLFSGEGKLGNQAASLESQFWFSKWSQLEKLSLIHF